MNNEPRTVFLEINSLASGADGVGRTDGKTCFVPFTAPGDKVEARVVKENAKMIRASLTKILEAGTSRRKPLCPLVGKCGGCSWQHVDYQQQLQAKGAFVERAVGISPVSVFPSNPEYGYRRLARLHLRTGALGFKRFHQDKVVHVSHCPVLSAELNDCLPLLFESLQVPQRLRLEIRLVSGKDGPAVHLSCRDHLPQELYTAATDLSDHFTSVTLEAAGFFAHLGGEKLVPVQGGDGLDLVSQTRSFGQANGTVNRALCETVGSWLSELSVNSAVELYSGSGNLTVMIPKECKTVFTGEMDADACAAAQENLLSRGRRSVKVVNQDALAVYLTHGKGADLVLLDPPRTGAKDLCREIAACGNPNVVYVSCDPGTLGRDVAILKKGGYKPVRAAGFDMFPQTAHMETAVHLTRE